jgi:hypothetical protein
MKHIDNANNTDDNKGNPAKTYIAPSKYIPVSLPFATMVSLLMASPTGIRGQMIVSDPALSAITLGSGIAERQVHEAIREKQNTIQSLQAATASVVGFINDWHQKLYEGLVQVSGAVSDAYSVKECLETLAEIYELERQMVEEARENPLALAFAIRFQREMVMKAIRYYGEIQTTVLASGDGRILMDAGERTALVNKILTDLRSIKALAATSCYRVRWAVKNGVINTINPFSAFVNRDARIVQDILKRWTY